MPISSGHAGEGPAHAVVGKQADAGLGHGEAIALAGDAMRAVERDAHAGAHHHAVDQRDGGLDEAFELPVERVFRRQRLDGLCLAVAAPFGDLAHVAAGAEGALGRRRRSPPHRSAGSRAQRGKAAAMAARMAVVSAFSACGRFSVTNAAAPSVPIRISAAASSPARRRAWRQAGAVSTLILPQVVPVPCPQLRDSHVRPQFRAIHDCRLRSQTPVPIRGGINRSRGRGWHEGLILNDPANVWRWPQRSACWPPQARLRRSSTGAVRRGRPQPLRHAAGRQAGQWPAVLPARPSQAALAPWSPQEYRAGTSPLRRPAEGSGCGGGARGAHARRHRVRHAGADEAHQHRQEPAGGVVAAADRHLRHDRGAAPDGWSATCSRWRASIWAPRSSASRP